MRRIVREGVYGLVGEAQLRKAPRVTSPTSDPACGPSEHDTQSTHNFLGQIMTLDIFHIELHRRDECDSPVQ